MEIIKQASVACVLGAILTILSYEVNSVEFSDFLLNNVIVINISIIGIMVTVYSFMLPMLTKVKKSTNTDFAIKSSLNEQIGNIAFSIILVILSNGDILNVFYNWVVLSLILSSLIYGLWQIWDVGNVSIIIYRAVKKIDNETTN